MEELAEAALEASGQAVADALSDALDGAPSAALGVVQFLDVAQGPVSEEGCPGCPIAPTALESPIISPVCARWRPGASANGGIIASASERTDGLKSRWPRPLRPLCLLSRVHYF